MKHQSFLQIMIEIYTNIDRLPFSAPRVCIYTVLSQTLGHWHLGGVNLILGHQICQVRPLYWWQFVLGAKLIHVVVLQKDTHCGVAVKLMEADEFRFNEFPLLLLLKGVHFALSASMSFHIQDSSLWSPVSSSDILRSKSDNLSITSSSITSWSSSWFVSQSSISSIFLQ